MAKEKSKKIVSMRELARASNIKYSKIYANSIGRYEQNTLTEAEKTRLSNALYEGLDAWSELLGVKFNMKRAS